MTKTKTNLMDDPCRFGCTCEPEKVKPKPKQDQDSCRYCRIRQRFGHIRYCKRHSPNVTMTKERFYSQKEVDSLLLSQRQEILREVREKVKENFNQKIKEAQQDDLRVYSKVLIDVRDIALEELSSFLSDMEGKE